MEQPHILLSTPIELLFSIRKNHTLHSNKCSRTIVKAIIVTQKQLSYIWHLPNYCCIVVQFCFIRLKTFFLHLVYTHGVFFASDCHKAINRNALENFTIKTVTQFRSCYDYFTKNNRCDCSNNRCDKASAPKICDRCICLRIYSRNFIFSR